MLLVIFFVFLIIIRYYDTYKVTTMCTLRGNAMCHFIFYFILLLHSGEKSFSIMGRPWLLCKFGKNGKSLD
jgi:hypothetical protein